MFCGLVTQVHILKVGVSELGFKSSTPQEEAWSLSSFLIVGRHAGVVYMVRLCLSLSYRFRCGCFHICLMWRNCSARFVVSFRENCSIRSYRFAVSLSGGEFRILLCHHLEPLWSAHIHVQAGPWIPACLAGAVILLAWDAGNLGFLFFQIITSSDVLPLAQ